MSLLLLHQECHVRMRFTDIAKYLLVLLLGFKVFGSLVIASEPIDSALSKKWASAISNDRTDLLQQMLDRHIRDQGEPIELLQLDAPNGKSALMTASKNGDFTLVQRMVKLGASINELTLTGGTPLMFAVLGNQVSIAQWLVEQGAKINAKGSNGWSAATIAGAKGQSDMLQWLINAGADINSPDVYRFTPLMRAVDNRHHRSAQVLLEQGQASVDFKDESDNTALHFAVANKHVELVELLLSYGANPLHANRHGITPRDLAKPFPVIAKLFKTSLTK